MHVGRYCCTFLDCYNLQSMLRAGSSCSEIGAAWEDVRITSFRLQLVHTLSSHDIMLVHVELLNDHKGS